MTKAVKEATRVTLHVTPKLIQAFADREMERFFRLGQAPRSGWQDVAAVALRKLDMLDAARVLADLNASPGNRLDVLRADRAGQHSIRINAQWRICFTWTSAGPVAVEIVDYH